MIVGNDKVYYCCIVFKKKKMILPTLPSEVVEVTTVVDVDDGDIIVTSKSYPSFVTVTSIPDGATEISPSSKYLTSDEWWSEFWGDRWVVVVLMMFALWFLLEIIKLMKGMDFKVVVFQVVYEML